MLTTLSTRAKVALVVIVLGTLLAESAVALEGGRGLLRRRQGVSTPQTTAAPEKNQPTETQAKKFVAYYEATVRPLEIEASRLSWIANVSGREADFQKKRDAEDKLDLCLANPKRFAELKAIKEAGVHDPQLARQIAVLYLEFLGRQVPPELLKKISAKSNAVEREFNVYRYDVGGKKVTDNDISRILVESRDSKERQAAWEARMTIGRAVLADLRAVVALRRRLSGLCRHSKHNG